MTIKEFLKLAKIRGFKINHGNPLTARPLKELCNNIKTKYPTHDWEELIG